MEQCASGLSKRAIKQVCVYFQNARSDLGPGGTLNVLSVPYILPEFENEQASISFVYRFWSSNHAGFDTEIRKA